MAKYEKMDNTSWTDRAREYFEAMRNAYQMDERDREVERATKIMEDLSGPTVKYDESRNGRGDNYIQRINQDEIWRRSQPDDYDHWDNGDARNSIDEILENKLAKYDKVKKEVVKKAIPIVDKIKNEAKQKKILERIGNEVVEIIVVDDLPQAIIDPAKIGIVMQIIAEVLDDDTIQ